jgi:hypothetical protein
MKPRSVPYPHDAPLICAWCRKAFDTIVDLLGHVDQTHLEESNDTTPTKAHRAA